MTGPGEARKGVLYALAAFVFWGLSPIYFKALVGIDPLEILAHRVLWSVPFVAGLMLAARNGPALLTGLRTPRVVATLALSGALVATNWFTFIYSITESRLVEASLGYYVNPLVNVALGVLFLRERLRPLQLVAVLLAAAGTTVLALGIDRVPWITLILAFSFGFYGLLRKTVRLESVNGLLIETGLLSPLALIWVIHLARTGDGAFGTTGLRSTLLLALAGVVTAVPLVWYTSGARRLRYSTIGLIQYLAPTLQLLLGVGLYGERFTRAHGITFALIWAGLALFVGDAWVADRGRR